MGMNVAWVNRSDVSHCFDLSLCITHERSSTVNLGYGFRRCWMVIVPFGRGVFLRILYKIRWSKNVDGFGRGS